MLPTLSTRWSAAMSKALQTSAPWRFRLTKSLELDRHRPHELVCGPPRKLTGLRMAELSRSCAMEQTVAETNDRRTRVERTHFAANLDRPRIARPGVLAMRGRIAIARLTWRRRDLASYVCDAVRVPASRRYPERSSRPWRGACRWQRR
jgi:hypothetical protein